MYVCVYLSAFINHSFQKRQTICKSSVVFNNHFRASSISIQRAQVKLCMLSSSNIITKLWNISNLKKNSTALLAFCTHLSCLAQCTWFHWNKKKCQKWCLSVLIWQGMTGWHIERVRDEEQIIKRIRFTSDMQKNCRSWTSSNRWIRKKLCNASAINLGHEYKLERKWYGRWRRR